MISELDIQQITQGFENPVLGPQQTFQAILEAMAHLALITRPSTMPPLDDFKIGDEEHPESAATLIVQVERFKDRNDKILSGAGTKNGTHFSPAGIHSKFWGQWQLQAAPFPLGVEVFFTCNDLLAALPKKTQVSRSI